jgi:carboxyl-terminal processing protease
LILIGSYNFSFAPRQAATPNAKGREADPKFEPGRILTTVLNLVELHYIDSDRISPLEMAKSSLAALSKNVPEIEAKYDDKLRSLIYRVEENELSLTPDRIDDLGAVQQLFQTILGFTKNKYTGSLKLSEIEYIAIDGMLETLDPHSRMLTPDIYKEFKVSTGGKFGGLGIVISVRDGDLTVISAIEGTPAFKAGIQSKDKIVKIEEESTINMSLNEAVNKLRGPKGTDVTIAIMRKGFVEPKSLTLTRDIIEIESVDSDLFEDGIGYLKAKNFQENTQDDIELHLQRLKCLKVGNSQDVCNVKKNPAGLRAMDLSNVLLNGMILDLRNNPGGLLDRAISMADTFLKSGTIVTTVETEFSYRNRKESKAEAEGTEPDYPLLVLVNGGSASASEIVAAAIKNLNRGLVVGDNTFGKGSVQTIYPLDDDSALKLTIAKYLTPGDISIQSLGITPDVKLVPSIIATNHADLVPDEEYNKEQDLDKHLENEHKELNTPIITLPYFDQNASELFTKEYAKQLEKKGKDKAKGKAQKTTGDRDKEVNDKEVNNKDSDDKDIEENSADDLYGQLHLEKDYAVQLCHKMLKNFGTNATRSGILPQLTSLTAGMKTEEEKKIEQAFSLQQIDWSAGEDSGDKTPVKAQVLFKVDTTPAETGRDVTLTLTVKNSGNYPLYQLLGRIDSKNYLFSGREFPLGRINPNKSRSYSLQMTIPEGILSQKDLLTFKFQELHGHTPPDYPAYIELHGPSAPEFSYSYQIIDDGRCGSQGNGDGLIALGETVCMKIAVKNIGHGPSKENMVYLKNLAGKEIFISKGRVELDQLQPGEVKQGDLLFKVQTAIRDEENQLITTQLKEFELELSIIDLTYRDFLTNKLKFSIVPNQTATVSPIKQTLTVTADKALIYGGASPYTPVIAEAGVGQKFLADRQYPGFFRVQFGDDWSGWIKSTVVSPSQDQAKPDLKLPLYIQTLPPDIDIISKEIRGTGKNAKYIVHGRIQRTNKAIKDTYIFVDENKLFFKSFHKSEAGNKADDGRFMAELPLKEGNNLITIVARDEDDTLSKMAFYVDNYPGVSR